MSKPRATMCIKDQVLEAMHYYNLSIYELSMRTKVPLPSLYRWLNYEAKRINFEYMETILVYLGFSLTWKAKELRMYSKPKRKANRRGPKKKPKPYQKVKRNKLLLDGES